ncbi:MAG: hypothetical protein QOH12_1080 [Solirubrobacteraceae bacterium]|jgi:hypothetical protein|nr:hypothetical protein [Solirubrobacteraceae bacterium]
MRSVWTFGICLAAATGLVLLAIGVAYLGVDAGSLPKVLGKVPGSTAHFTERGLFGVMAGGLLALIAISLQQFRPGGGLAPPTTGVDSDETGGEPTASR